MEIFPDWVLLLAFWIHMLATVFWLGFLAVTSLWVMPMMRKSLSEQDYSFWIGKTNNRLIPISWISISILLVTGLMQMSVNPNYAGLFTFTNNWAIAILLKHLVFFSMVGISAHISWKIHPALLRAALRKASGKGHREARLNARLQKLVRVNLILGAISLLFTAIARIS